MAAVSVSFIIIFKTTKKSKSKFELLFLLFGKFHH